MLLNVLLLNIEHWPHCSGFGHSLDIFSLRVLVHTIGALGACFSDYPLYKSTLYLPLLTYCNQLLPHSDWSV